MTTTTKGTSARETVLSHIEHDSNMPFRFQYDSLPLEAGFYLVRIDSQPPQIAYFDGSSEWNQIGIDYDVWQYNGAFAGCTIMVHARINMSTCASDTTSLESPLDPESSSVLVPVHTESGLMTHIEMTEKEARKIEGLTREAESLAQGPAIDVDEWESSADEIMFRKFTEWYRSYSGTRMTHEELDFMQHSEEFHAFREGVTLGIAVEQSYQRIPYTTFEAPSGT